MLLNIKIPRDLTVPRNLTNSQEMINPDENYIVPEILNEIKGRKFYDCVEGIRKQFGVDGKYSDIVKPEGYLSVEDIKIKNEPIAKNSSASIWDMGDRIALLEFHSKMNSIDPMTIEMIEKASRIVNGNAYTKLQSESFWKPTYRSRIFLTF